MFILGCQSIVRLVVFLHPGDLWIAGVGKANIIRLAVVLHRGDLAGRAAPGQILPDQALASRTLVGQSPPSQSHPQLRPNVESHLKISRTSGRRRMVLLSVEFQAINKQE